MPEAKRLEHTERNRKRMNDHRAKQKAAEKKAMHVEKLRLKKEENAALARKKACELKEERERESHQSVLSTDWNNSVPRDFETWMKLSHEEKTRIAHYG
jgi:hypothetical protein